MPQFKKIYFEIGNICNLQCTFCPEVDRAKFQIELQAFQKVLKQIKPLTERVCFHLMGEPTAHPNFHALVKTAEEMQVPVEITTNGTMLNESITQALLNSTIVQVNFSLQSYFDNFPQKDPNTYLNKIFEFTHRAFKARPDLYINYRLWNLGEGDQTQNESTLLKIENEFNASINRNVDLGFRKSKKVTQRLYLHFDQRFEWPSLSGPVKSTQGTCYGSRDHIGIHANGDVVPCCLDKEAILNMGNIYEDGIESILESPRFQSIKSGFEAGELRQALCQRCDYVTRFK